MRRDKGRERVLDRYQEPEEHANGTRVETGEGKED
jgi:hypothetical protein